MSRTVSHRYVDPLDAVWLECARRVGLKVVRAADAYASTDGAGTLILTDPGGFDEDDCLAQMILHELCHALVQGEASWRWVDWGLDNEGSRDDVLEHACLRLQAALLQPLGLRRVLAPTTDFRSYYDALPADAFEERVPGDRPSALRARAAWARADQPPVGPHLRMALTATASILHATRSFAFATHNRPAMINEGQADTISTRDEAEPHGAPTSGLPSLLDVMEPTTPTHRLGSFLHPSPGHAACGGCAWAAPGRAGKLRCQAHEGASVRPDEPACERFEKDLDCLTCGACCREAYDVVVVGPKDPAAVAHRSLLVRNGKNYDLQRVEGRCVALRGGAALPAIRPALSPQGGLDPSGAVPQPLPRIIPDDTPFTCSIYEERPQTCRDFTRGQTHCASARRRVGLSR